MQTFVPTNNIREIAQALDYKRLGKQRVEVLQILKANLGMTKGWASHPASIMWRDNPQGLSFYGIAMCEEWVARGYKDTCIDKIHDLCTPDEDDLPYWWGDPDIMQSHQSNLIRKFPEHYAPMWPDTPDNLPYCWPAPLAWYKV